MLNEADLTSRGVSKQTAQAFVSALPPELGGPSPGARDNPSQSYPNQPGLVTGGPSPGARDDPTESYPNQPITTVTGGGGGSGGGSGSTPVVPQLDWSAYLANWGFTPDIINQLTKIFSTYSDPNQASAAALAYVRGTDWYQQTFPGIGTGIKLGLFGDEQGYRSYVNQLDGLYQNYYGRNVTSNEVANYLGAGRDSTFVSNKLQGQSLLAAQQPDIQSELGAFDENGPATSDELSQYGDYLGGIGNMVGPQLQQRLQKAQQRMQTIFQGQLASPSMSVINGKLGSSLTAGKTPDIGAL